MTDAISPVSAGVRLGLLGSPNSGKTTLFNALTGLRAKVGNYPGVTVEHREGIARIDDLRVEVIDLPGTYGLEPVSPDEAVVSQVLSGSIEGIAPPEALILTVDACSLERSLWFVGQALTLDLPTCLVLTMTDELSARGGEIDRERLQAALGVPVISVVGHRGLGLSTPAQPDPRSLELGTAAAAAAEHPGRPPKLDGVHSRNGADQAPGT